MGTIFLKVNTARIVTVGPFYDKTDGVTIENSLTITNERITMVLDNNDGSAPSIILDNVTGATSGTDNDLNYITNCDAGLMQLELSAANTNYVGRSGMLSITDAANHVPVFHDVVILPANIYDALFPGTDYLQAHMVEITGDLITAAAIADNAIAAEHIAAAAIDFATFAADCKTGSGLKANVESISAGAITAAAIATGAIDADAIADNAIDAGAIAADAITAAKIADGAIDAATFAAGAINAAAIANGAIDNATFAADVGSTAYATNIIALAADKAILNTSALASVCTEARLSELDAGTAGKAANQIDVIQTDTTTDIPALIDALPTAAEIKTAMEAGGGHLAEILTDTGTTLPATLATIAGYVDTEIGALTTELAKVPKSDSTVSWNATALAAIQQQVDDAFTSDTGPLSIAWGTMIERIYQMINNRMAVTEATGAVALRNIGNSADIATGNVASSSGTTTRAELSWS